MKSKRAPLILVCCLVLTGATVWGQQGFKATPILKGSSTVGGQKLEYPKTDKPEITSVLLELEPGGESGRHMHPYPTHVYVLAGTLTVEMEDGSRHEYQTGKGFLETTNTWHNGKNLGETPLKVLVVFVGEEGKPNLVRPDMK